MVQPVKPKALPITVERKQRITRAVSAGQVVALRLRGGGGAMVQSVKPTPFQVMVDRKHRITRAVSAGQAVALRLRGGSASAELELPSWRVHAHVCEQR